MLKIKDDIRSRITLCIIAVLTGSVLRTMVAKFIFLQPDEEIFGYIAYRLIHGGNLEYLISSAFHWLGYPLFLSQWFSLFGVSLFLARMFSVFCSAIMIIFVYLTILKITKEAKYALIGSLLLAVLPFPLRYGHMVLSEPLVWVFVSSSVFVLIVAMEKDRWYLFPISGLLTFISVFIRRSALIMFFVVIITLLWVNRNSVRRSLKQTFSWAGGFLIPTASVISGLFIYYGWEKLQEMRFTRIPNITSDWKIGPWGITTREPFLYAAQPVVWKALPLVLITVVACGILIMALHRNRWKAVYTGAFLWPAFVAVAFDGHVTTFNMFVLMLLPLIPILFVKERSDNFHIALALVIGSAVGFSHVRISGDLWNTVLYSSVGAIVLIYLDDRMDSVLIRWILLIGGLAMLILIMRREPRIEHLFSFILPVLGIVYCIGCAFSRKVQKNGQMILWSVSVLVLWSVGFSDPMNVIFILFIFAAGALMPLVTTKKWRFLSLSFPFMALFFSFFLPEGILVEVLLIMILFVICCQILRFGKALKFAFFVTTVAAFLIVFFETNSVMLSFTAGTITGTISLMIPNLDKISSIWKLKIPERISILLVMMIFGYIAFYIFYSWREVYFTEFLFQAAVLGGLLFYVMMGGAFKVRYDKKGRIVRRIIKPVKVNKSIPVVLMILVLLSVPVSVSAYLQGGWFDEEPMDQRPYMNTIEDIAGWICENTDEGDKILAWHCYALEANRETILEVSNAKRYNVKKVVEDMEEMNVSVFVRCWYTDNGVWRNRPYFQDYIMENFVIDRIVDGNECWKKVVD